MKIAIVSNHDIQGGAARAAYRLVKGLRILKQHPCMIVRKKDSADPDVLQVSVKSPKYRREHDLFWITQKYGLDLNRTDLSNTFFSLPYPGYDISRAKVIREADVINLHWVAQFQSVESVGKLLALGKPVVWTLHDENPYTGGCHYTSGCDYFRTGCKDCPQIRINPNQAPALALRNKLDSWKGTLAFVSPSRWLAHRAKSSRVLRDFDISVIPNALEIDVFKPLDKEETKKSFGIDPAAVCILFNAEFHGEKRKGFKKLLKTLRFCLKNETFRELAARKKVYLMTVGDPQEELVGLDIPCKIFGYVHSDEKLSKIFSAADIYVLPSQEDNLPNTMMESMACGTPVVSFNVGGMPDMIKNGVTGFMASTNSHKELGEIILSLMSDPLKCQRIGRNCRKLIEDEYRLEDQAGKYLDLFEKLVGSSGSESCRTVSGGVTGKTETTRIILSDWEPQAGGDIYNAYRKSALRIVEEREAEKHLLKNISDDSPKKRPKIDDLLPGLREWIEVRILISYQRFSGKFLLLVLRTARCFQRFISRSK